MDTLINVVGIITAIVIAIYLYDQRQKAGSWKDVFTYEVIIEEDVEVSE